MKINFNKKLFNKKYISYIAQAYEYALKYLKVPTKEIEVDVNFINKKEIHRLNKQFRNTDRATDVLSFPNLLQVGVTNMQIIIDVLDKEHFADDVNPESNNIMLGSICICKKIAYKQAKEYGNTRAREVVYMAVHGLLHLLGYDHMIEEEKLVMRKTEEKIMKHIKLERK